MWKFIFLSLYENKTTNIDDAYELLKDRNDITHNVTDYYDSADSLLAKITFWQGLINMMWFASFIHLSRGQKDLERENKIADSCQKLFSMTLKEFYEITDNQSKKT